MEISLSLLMHCREWTSHVSVHANLKVPISCSVNMLLDMAVKIALAVGLFIVICVPPGIKSSQVVPDGLVYTEVERTLVRGVQGVFTCRFDGVPLSVYWRKGRDLDDRRLMVEWHDGEVSGPRFDDGSCDVDENYSLIINNVSTADSGRIYCTVSNNKGPLMNNYTDISVVDTAITTNPQATLQLRQAKFGLLQCTVHIKARRVSWKKGTTSLADESLVVMESNRNISERSGAGYYDGTYNITEEYSLVIKELQIHHEGLYVCEVTDDTGMSFRNHTFVNVVAQPLEPFPTIQECLNAEQHDPNYCTLVAKSGMTLTCQATKYYPSIDLVFLYGSRVVEHSDTGEWDNKDGTKNKTITITIATRGNNKGSYRCVASSIPGTNATESRSVVLQGDGQVISTLVVIFVYFLFITFTFSVAYFIWDKKRYETLRQRLDEVSMQPHRMIGGPIDKELANDIIGENRTSLFDTHQMLNDWQRHRLTITRVKQTIDKEKEPDDIWPYNDELNTISRHLTQESMKKVCKKLGIDFQCDDANDEGKRLETLRKWRTNASTQPIWDKWEQLFSALESINMGGLLPILKEPSIYKAELVDLAFHLLMQGFCPVAKELGINATKLASYRPVFMPSHLGIGTIKLLMELNASIEDTGLPMEKRSVFCKRIANGKSERVGITGMFEYNMSYGELCSISEAIHQHAQGRVDQEVTSGMLPGPGIPKALRILQDVLRLTNKDVATRRDTKRPLTAFALLKIWKEKPRPSVFNYRAALAYELRRNEMPDLADEVAEGKYMTERTSLVFIEDMVRGLNQDEIRRLGELLQLSGTSSDTISKEICAWVAELTTEKEMCRKSRPRKQRVKTGGTLYVPGGELLAHMAESPKESQLSESTMPLEHRDLNDRLVEHGFLDLAREIMIIEQRSVAGLLNRADFCK